VKLTLTITKGTSHGGAARYVWSAYDHSCGFAADGAEPDRHQAVARLEAALEDAVSLCCLYGTL
jgi:hypothetical protein